MPICPVFQIFSLFVASALFSPSLLASQDQLYGLGGRTTARVNGVTADASNSFAALYNPAALATSEGKQMSVSTTLVGARYRSFGTVRVDSPQFRTATGSVRDAEASLPDFSSTLWAIGYRHGFTLPFWDHRLAGIGLVLSGPMATLRNFSSPTPYDFTSLRYGTADSQFKGSASVGLELLPKRWSLGVGATVYISSSGIADTIIGTDNPTARMKMTVSMNSSWLLGNFLRYGEWNAAFVYRQRIRPQFAQQLQGQIDFAGNQVLNQPMLVESTLYFEPHLFELELQRRLGRVSVAAGISYQLWSQHEPPYMNVQAPARDGTMRTTIAPAIPFRDIWVPRVSVEVPWGDERWVASAGYQFRPTPVVDLRGPGNLLDSNTHVFGAGVGVRVAHGLLGTDEMRIQLSGQLHLMEKRQIQKADGAYIGGPGYDFKGTGYVLGISAEMRI